MEKFKCPRCGEIISINELISKNSNVLKHIDDETKNMIKKDYEKKLKEKENFYEEKLEIVLNNKKSQEEKLKSVVNNLEERIKQLTKDQDEKLKKEIELEKVKLEKAIMEKINALEKNNASLSERLKGKEELEKVYKDKYEIDLQNLKQKMDQQHNLEIQELKSRLEKAEEFASKIKISASSEFIGEFVEKNIKKELENYFPLDLVTDIPKGVKGADLLLKVRNNNMKVAGDILIEIKNTKKWEKKWIDKLFNDMKSHNYWFGIIITKTLPKDLNANQFKMVKENIGVCSIFNYLTIITLLREVIITAHKERLINENIENIKDWIYKIVRSPEFNRNIEYMINQFQNLKQSINNQQLRTIKYFEEQKSQIEYITHGMIKLQQQFQPALTLTNEKEKK